MSTNLSLVYSLQFIRVKDGVEILWLFSFYFFFFESYLRPQDCLEAAVFKEGALFGVWRELKDKSDSWHHGSLLNP